MNIRLWLLFAILGGNALRGGTIGSLDVSGETTTIVHSGDTLAFHVFTGNFARNASRFDVPAFPSDLTFALVTGPAGIAWEFAATVESTDRSVTAALGDLKFQPGVFTSGGYSGEVSTLQGYLHLAPLLSESLFGGGSIAIALQNLGPDLELGLSPYVLRQNMFVSLSAGSLSVGALPGWVELEEPQNQMGLSVFGAAAPINGGVETPEPGSNWLAGGGVFLCALSVLSRQFSRSRVINR